MPGQARAYQEELLNGTWQFLPAEGAAAPVSPAPEAVDAKALELDRSSGESNPWRAVQVPQFLNRTVWWLGDVSLEYEAQETARVKALPPRAAEAGAGWCARTFAVHADGAEKPEVYAKFEGVAMVSRVYCNGHFVGGHVGMFGSFECRLTPDVFAGEGNRLLVYMERGQPGSGEVVGTAVTMAITREMFSSLDSGLFGGFGRGPKARGMGIWQPVTLKVSQPGGRVADVFFNPVLDGHALTCTVQNPTARPVSGQLRYRVADARTGAVLAEEAVGPAVSIEASADKTITVAKHGLAPLLWTPDDPNLYNLTVQWESGGGEVLDCYACQVGYRTVTTRGEQVFLNGHPYWNRGANMPPYGYQPNNGKTARAFLRQMHDSNFVITRAHGNPWNHLWLGAADQVGIGVCVEGVRPWALMTTQPPPGQPMLDHWLAEQLESVREYRNHPSVLYYCISNEGLQGDSDNPEKLAIFKRVIDAVRALDPSRPLFQTSGDPDRQKLADLEDIHSYWGWYEPSSYVNDYTRPLNGLTLGDGRPFLDEEAAVPYQMIDTGGVHPSYLSKYMAQPWVGDLGTWGPDPSYFSEHIRAEAKLKAEKLRWSRKVLPTAGVMLFCCSTWMQGALSRPPAEWQPLPVWTAAAGAMQPVLAALDTEQAVFFAGSTVPTTVHVVNDDAQFRDLRDLKLTVEVLDAAGRALGTQEQALGDVAYYGVRNFPVQIRLPELPTPDERMVRATLRLCLTDAGGCGVSENRYPVRLAVHHQAALDKGRVVAVEGCNAGVRAALAATGASVEELGKGPADVVVLGPVAGTDAADSARRALKPGGRILVLENLAVERALCPDLLSAADDAPETKGEFVEMLGWAGHPPMFAGLEAMDWKWWAQAGEQATYVCRWAHHLEPGQPGVKLLGRYLAPHFYWSGDAQRAYAQSIAYPVFAVQRDWGEVVVCDLTICESLATDPRAERTLVNLLLQPLP